MEAQATWSTPTLAPTPTLVPTPHRVPDPASRVTQLVVEVSGTWWSVVLRRRPSRNWTSPNVLPISTPRGCAYFFSLLFQNADQLTTDLIVYFFRHSSGRGGVGNLTSGEVPHREGTGNPHGVNHPHLTHNHDAESFGRGGSGNISRDHSRDPGATGKNTRNPVSEFLHGLTHGGSGNVKNEPRGRSTGREGDLVASG